VTFAGYKPAMDKMKDEGYNKRAQKLSEHALSKWIGKKTERIKIRKVEYDISKNYLIIYYDLINMVKYLGIYYFIDNDEFRTDNYLSNGPKKGLYLPCRKDVDLILEIIHDVNPNTKYKNYRHSDIKIEDYIG
jgi:hypothetical protein